MSKEERPGAFSSFAHAFASWRTLSVSLLSFSSGMPLGLVWIAIPDWMRSAGADIRVVGLITLAQAPWTFKMVWSPLMDRYSAPFLDRRRSWMILAQVGLLAAGLALAGVGDHPDAPWVVAALAFALALAAATQDIAIDAYAVEVLEKREQGAVVGARVAIYRAAMYLAGAFAITAAGLVGWGWVNLGLALLYIPMMAITVAAPASPLRFVKPKTLRQAVWLPFLGFLSRDRALGILAFVFFYKFADNLAQALLRPFLFDMGYTSVDRGVLLGVVGAVAIIAGTFIGGFITTGFGLGHALWLFGLVQIFSNIGYILVARVGVNRPLMYSAMTFETFTQGLGTGAFSVLLLRMTQKRFSATQYALFSSLFGLPRVVTGPIAGVAVKEWGWETFFWITMLAGIPGMILLQRFSPLGVREPHFTVREPTSRTPLSQGALVARGVLGGVITLAGGTLVSTFMTALRGLRDEPPTFDVPAALAGLLAPSDLKGWSVLAGFLVLAAVGGLAVAAVSAARHGEVAAFDEDEDEDEPVPEAVLTDD